jgi:hypothetical protein
MLNGMYMRFLFGAYSPRIPRYVALKELIPSLVLGCKER